MPLTWKRDTDEKNNIGDDVPFLLSLDSYGKKIIKEGCEIPEDVKEVYVFYDNYTKKYVEKLIDSVNDYINKNKFTFFDMCHIMSFTVDSNYKINGVKIADKKIHDVKEFDDERFAWKHNISSLTNKNHIIFDGDNPYWCGIQIISTNGPFINFCEGFRFENNTLLFSGEEG